ncbi:S8 family serine peptidase [Saccharothrix longispora]|uniref:Subtilisin family serine protease n=1 Tax=Saccharothrix longispora TaxID=33920 RepID=A0ABU1Q4G6_9PSEU|nr:S8 family serine peptidase [Saccharothrix longispora]MDR6597780.1 subtilisin family serine protease [Saccharothrix longispora]
MNHHRAVWASAAVALIASLVVVPASAREDTGGTPARPVPPNGRQAAHASPTEPATGGPGPVGADLARATGAVTAFVELATTPAAEAYGEQRERGLGDPAAAARAARADTDDRAARVLDALRDRDAGAREVATTRNAVPGVVVTADAAALREAVALPGVKSVRPTVPKVVQNSGAVRLTRAVRAWRDTGLLGDGVRIGIVDTGIDYTHADFGGPGTVAAHDAVDRTAPWTPTAKVVGGHDFVGEDYDANEPATATPKPDPNPMDCQGHGTHVAGTAAGLGENADGTTFTGDHGELTPDDLDAMRIGPGTAPKAQLYALKVFGCTGATDLVSQALDWSLDPNGDGDFTDHLDVVNLSLGTDYGAQDDPDNLFVRKVVEHGVAVVASAGNGGDFYDVGGSPANAPEALAVANTRDAFTVLDGIEADGVRRPGQYSVAYTDYPALDRELPAVALADQANLDGCDPITEDLTGRYAWLEWDEDDATRRCGSGARTDHAQAAGAAGVLLPATSHVFKAGIAGNAAIPVFQLTAEATEAVRPGLAGGALRVRMTGALRAAVPTTTPSIADTMTPSSSRGVRGPVAAKPDVAAPGDTVFSADTGTGNGGVSRGGTSMSAPHVAGIVALLRQAHPDWTVEEVKAAVMNTAGGVVTDGDDRGTGTPEAPMRVGAGRVDTADALAADLLAMVEDHPGAVGVAFGPVEAAEPLSVSRTVRVVNKSSSWRTAGLSYQPATEVPGTRFEVWPPTLRIPPNGEGTAKVTLRVRPAELRKTADPTLAKTQADVPRQFLAEASGRLLVRSSGRLLRVPVHAAPKPVADVEAVQDGDVLRLRGRGLDQGEGDEAYRSLVSVFELGGTSPELPDCADEVKTDCALNRTAKGGDLRYAGVASTGPGEGALLAFGIATWHDWVTLGVTNTPEVRIDTTGDGVHDFTVEAAKPTDAQGSVTADVWYSAAKRVSDGEVVSELPLNGQYGDVDTNLMDSDVVVLPVTLAALGIDPNGTSAPITYTVGTTGKYTAPGDADEYVDRVEGEPMAFDPLQPGTAVTGGLTFAAEDGAELEVRRALGKGLLLLHHHNASGRRAQVLPAG